MLRDPAIARSGCCTIIAVERFRTVLGLKVTVTATVAASFGGVLLFSAILFKEAAMTNLINRCVWCGVALLWSQAGRSPKRETEPMLG